MLAFDIECRVKNKKNDEIRNKTKQTEKQFYRPDEFFCFLFGDHNSCMRVLFIEMNEKFVLLRMRKE